MIVSKEMEIVEEKMPSAPEHALLNVLKKGIFAVQADYNKWEMIEGDFHKKILILIDTPLNNFWCLYAVKKMKKLITAMQIKRKRLDLHDIGFININHFKSPSIEEIVTKSKAEYTLLFAQNWLFSEPEIAIYQSQSFNNKPLLRLPDYETILKSEETRTTAWITIKRFLDMK